MAKTTTASRPMTNGQIENAVAKLRDALRKHRTEFGSEPVQLVLGVENLGMELLAPFRKRVEAVSNLIVRRVTVNRTRTPQSMLDATGRKQHTNQDVVDAMPRGEGEKAEVYFFKPDLTERGGWISDADLEEEFESRGFAPADPYTLGAVNEVDPAFTDSHPNGTHWKDAQGRWCFAAFGRWYDEPSVSVHRSDDDWDGRWWFAGVRK